MDTKKKDLKTNLQVIDVKAHSILSLTHIPQLFQLSGNLDSLEWTFGTYMFLLD